MTPRHVHSRLARLGEGERVGGGGRWGRETGRNSCAGDRSRAPRAVTTHHRLSGLLAARPPPVREVRASLPGLVDPAA